MKTFLAVYIGTDSALQRSRWNELNEEERKARERAGIEGWMAWGQKYASSIVSQGSPLGKTKRVAPEGLSDIKNTMAAYVVLQAESHEAAAKMFEGHPHFTVFPGDSVEIMECLPIPGA